MIWDFNAKKMMMMMMMMMFTVFLLYLIYATDEDSLELLKNVWFFLLHFK